MATCNEGIRSVFLGLAIVIVLPVLSHAGELSEYKPPGNQGGSAPSDLQQVKGAAVESLSLPKKNEAKEQYDVKEVVIVEFKSFITTLTPEKKKEYLGELIIEQKNAADKGDAGAAAYYDKLIKTLVASMTKEGK